MVQTFGRAQPPAEHVPFKFTIDRDGETEVLDFTAVVRKDITALATTLINANKHPDKAMGGMFMLIAKMLDNRDGTPAKWKPEAVRRKGPVRSHRMDRPEEWPTASGDIEQTPEVEQGEVFRAPCGDEAGQLLPMERAAEFLELEAGSSRRRWLYLVNEDDEATVDIKDLTKLFEWLVGMSSGGPTPASS